MVGAIQDSCVLLLIEGITERVLIVLLLIVCYVSCGTHEYFEKGLRFLLCVFLRTGHEYLKILKSRRSGCLCSESNAPNREEMTVSFSSVKCVILLGLLRVAFFYLIVSHVYCVIKL